MRLIDADELMKKVLYLPTGQKSHGVPIMFHGVVAADVDDMPTAGPESLRPRWIPVTERLPVEAKKVLCFLALSGGPMVETGYYMGDEGWYYTGIEAPHHGIVTHWMPLPEPPESEGV